MAIAIIIVVVEVKRLHRWQVSVAEALEIQRRLASQVSRTNGLDSLHYVAGADISFDRVHGTATAAVVVLSYPELALVETKTANGKIEFPYIPGLLSFREAPLTLKAFEMLKTTPELVIVDGHGYAHPRRMGFACHIGLFLDKPTIGCAKSLLVGNYEPPSNEPGSYTEIVDKGEVIGAALRTQADAALVFVSTGQKIDLSSAVEWVLKCCRGHRLPEPTRLAHLAAGGFRDLVRQSDAPGTQHQLFK